MPIINGQGRIGVRVQVPLLLDTYTGAAAAYSLRKLSNTYSGPAIRVRRSSNNAELNIGFNSDGTLDTTTLLSFVGAGDGFVVTIFDQSGNGLDLSWWQAVTQAKIVTNGVIESHNGKPTINTDGKGGYSFYKSSIGYWQTLTYKTMFMVGKTETVNTASGDYNYLHDGERVWFNSYQNKYGALVNTYSNPISGVAPTGWVSYQLDGASTNQTLFYLNMRSSKLYMSINGNSETMMGAFPSTLSTRWMFSFGPDYGFASRFNGKFSEIIFYNSDKSANKAAIESNMNSYYSVYSPMDSDAQAFITAASITDSTQKSAVNTLVTSLKSAGLWTKMKALYPFVGGTATSHKFNLKDPRDLDAAYRLVFNGGWTHSSTGAKPNGSNGYANTFFIPQSNQTLNSNGMGIYITQNSSSSSDIVHIGTFNTVVRSSAIAVTPTSLGARLNGNALSASITGGAGCFDVQKTSATTTKLYKNGVLLTTGNSGGDLDNNPIYIGTLQLYGGPYSSGYVNSEFRMSYFSDGLTDADVTALNTAVQAFQTTLGRQVA